MAPFKGRDAIRAIISGLLGESANSVHFQILHQVVSGRLVMNERVDTIVMKTGSVDLPVCGVFELTADGKIGAWRDYFDMKQFTGQ